MKIAVIRRHIPTRKGAMIMFHRTTSPGAPSLTRNYWARLSHLLLGLAAGLFSGCRDRSVGSTPYPPPDTAAADIGAGKTPDLAAQKAPATRPAAATRPAITTRPAPPASADHIPLRQDMVRKQIAHPRDGRRPVKDERVLEAMRLVPRHVFAPMHPPSLAYADTPLPIGHDQTISQPYIVALMTELLELKPDDRVLEIGTGSGYQAAVLAHLTPHVYTIEIVEPLARQAIKTLKEQGYEEVNVRIGDGFAGWPEAAPFQAILLTCAAPEVPGPLWEQLAPGGRLVMPLGPAGGTQRLVVMTKRSDGSRHSRTITAVRFVPMTGEHVR